MTDNSSKLEHALNAWLQERQELIVLYCSVCGVHEQLNDSPPKIQRLKSFCQILVDYCSAGHFEVFPELLKQVDSSSADMSELLGKIQDTTDISLDFNDRYDTEELLPETLEPLSRHLSKLGEALEMRFDLEDQLLDRAQSGDSSAVA